MIVEVRLRVLQNDQETEVESRTTWVRADLDVLKTLPLAQIVAEMMNAIKRSLTS